MCAVVQIMTCLGAIRRHSRDVAWSASLCQTFFALAVGAQIPQIVVLPPSTCGFKKFVVDDLGDHVTTRTTHSGTKKPHDWTVEQLTDFFRTTTTVKTTQVALSRGLRVSQRGVDSDIELAVFLADTVGTIKPRHGPPHHA